MIILKDRNIYNNTLNINPKQLVSLLYFHTTISSFISIVKTRNKFIKLYMQKVKSR